MSTPRKQKKKAIKPARRDSRASTDAAVTPSIFGGSLLSLESRIMFDGAAVATASIVNTEQIAQNQAEDSSSAGDAAATDAPTGEPSATADQALFDALAALDVSAARQDTLFVSTSVLDYQQLLDGISPDVEAHILDPARDGVEQMGDISSNYASIDPVNLIGNGTEAGMHLSPSFLIQHSISTSYGEQFQQIGQSLSADAELLVYGSSVGQGEAGQLAIDMLPNLTSLTGADVAASKDRTGHTTESADWHLEASTGSIETSSVISEITSGAVVGQGNLISGTTVGVQTDNRDNRTIQGNLIGTDAFSTGVASNAFEVQILGNAIYSNTGLGIDVEGVSSATANDAPAAADSTIDVISGALAPAHVEIVFVDTSVENYQTLINGINNPDARVVLLDASRDGMEQIVAALGQMGRVDAIHLISHGSEGQLDLGATTLNATTMRSLYAGAAGGDQVASHRKRRHAGLRLRFRQRRRRRSRRATLGADHGRRRRGEHRRDGDAALGANWDLDSRPAPSRPASRRPRGAGGVARRPRAAHAGFRHGLGVDRGIQQDLHRRRQYPVTISVSPALSGNPMLERAIPAASRPPRTRLQFTLGATGSNTITIDFSGQPGGSVANVGFALYDVDNVNRPCSPRPRSDGTTIIAPTQVATSAYNSITAETPGTGTTVTGCGHRQRLYGERPRRATPTSTSTRPTSSRCRSPITARRM